MRKNNGATSANVTSAITQANDALKAHTVYNVQCTRMCARPARTVRRWQDGIMRSDSLSPPLARYKHSLSGGNELWCMCGCTQ